MVVGNPSGNEIPRARHGSEDLVVCDATDDDGGMVGGALTSSNTPQSSGNWANTSSNANGRSNSLISNSSGVSVGSSASSAISMTSVVSSGSERDTVLFRRPSRPIDKVTARFHGMIAERAALPSRGASSVILALESQERKLLAVKDTEILEPPLLSKTRIRAVKNFVKVLAERIKHDSIVEYISVDIFKRKAPITVVASSSKRPSESAQSTSMATPQLPFSVSIASMLQPRSKSLVVFMEYVPGVSLQMMMSAFAVEDDPRSPVRCLSRELAITVIHRSAGALDYLHQNDLTHGALNCTNILVTVEQQVKLTGLAGTALYTPWTGHAAQDNTMELIRAMRFMPPEWLNPFIKDHIVPEHEAPADIWALGCVAFEVLTGQMPFSACVESSELLLAAKSAELHPDKSLGPLFSALEDDAKDFILKCLKSDPEKRATAASLLDHPLLKTVATTSPGGSGAFMLDPSLAQINDISPGAPPLGRRDPHPNQVVGDTNSISSINSLDSEDVEAIRKIGLAARRASIADEDASKYIRKVVLYHVQIGGVRADFDMTEDMGPIHPLLPPGGAAVMAPQNDDYGDSMAPSDAIESFLSDPTFYPPTDADVCRDLLEVCVAAERRDESLAASVASYSTSASARSIGQVRFSDGSLPASPTAAEMTQVPVRHNSRPSNSFREFLWTFILCCCDDEGELKVARRRARRRQRLKFRLLLVGIAILLVAVIVAIVVLFAR